MNLIHHATFLVLAAIAATALVARDFAPSVKPKPAPLERPSLELGEASGPPAPRPWVAKKSFEVALDLPQSTPTPTPPPCSGTCETTYSCLGGPPFSLVAESKDPTTTTPVPVLDLRDAYGITTDQLKARLIQAVTSAYDVYITPDDDLFLATHGQWNQQTCSCSSWQEVTTISGCLSSVELELILDVLQLPDPYTSGVQNIVLMVEDKWWYAEWVVENFWLFCDESDAEGFIDPPATLILPMRVIPP